MITSFFSNLCAVKERHLPVKEDQNYKVTLSCMCICFNWCLVDLNVSAFKNQNAGFNDNENLKSYFCKVCTLGSLAVASDFLTVQI